MRTWYGIVLVMLIGLLIGCNPSPNAQLEKNKDVVRKLVEAVNTQNYELLDEIITPDFVRHCQATPEIHVKSRDEMKQFLRQDLEVFPDIRISLDAVIAEGNLVAGRLTYFATQEGVMGPFPATGKKVELTYLSIVRLEDGKIAEMWVEWDNLAILGQLGHYPPREKSEE